MAKEKEIFIHGQVEDGKVIVPGCVRNGVPERKWPSRSSMR